MQLGGKWRNGWRELRHEIALVFAHEYAHALLGHVAKTRNNAVWGEVIAGLAGLSVIAANADTITESQIEDTMGSTAIGRVVGATVFSKRMELEADHLALFMLADAGYNARKGMQFFQQKLRIEPRQQNLWVC